MKLNIACAITSAVMIAVSCVPTPNWSHWMDVLAAAAGGVMLALSLSAIAEGR